MPKPERAKKREVIAVRMTSKVKKDVEREAARDGMEPSAWVRLLIAQELIAREKEAAQGR